MLYRWLLAATICGGIAIAYTLPNGPLLVWWLTAALGFGGYLALVRDLGRAERAKRLVRLHALLIPSALVTTQFAARRLTSATHLRFTGVLIERADTVVIGSGVQGADLILPPVLGAAGPWWIRMVRDGTAWRLDEGSDVEQVRISSAGKATATTYSVLNGRVVSDSAERVVVFDRSYRPVDTLALGFDESGAFIRSSGYGTYRLTVAGRLAGRYRRLLRAGIAVGTLPGNRSRTAPFDRLIRVQRLAPRDVVNGSVAPKLDRLMEALPPVLRRTAGYRLVVTAAAPFRVRSAAASLLPLALGDSVRVEVRHMGAVWQFKLLQKRRETTAVPGLAIRFERNPRPIDSPLPAGNNCRSGVACGVLSLRRLPAPIPHISLDAAGLDPARFGLTARLVAEDDGIAVVLARDSVAIRRGGGERAVPVEDLSAPIGAARTGFWILLAATSNIADGLPVVLVSAGIVLLLFVMHGLVDGAAAAPRAGGSERPLAFGTSAILSLLLTRLTIGARVTFFPPYASAGLDTAVGLWVAISAVTLALLSWSRWAPGAIKVGLAGRRFLSPTVITAAFRPIVASRPKSPAALLAAGTTSIVLLLLVSINAVGMGVLAGAAVVSVWFVLAWTIAFSARQVHSFEHGPLEVIEYHATHSGEEIPPVNEAGSRLRLLSFLNGPLGNPVFYVSLLWSMAVWSPVVGAMVAVAGSTSWWSLRSRYPGGPEKPGLVALAAIGSTLAVAALRYKSENGAMATFMMIILVALVSVRIGRALAARSSESPAGAVQQSGVAVGPPAAPVGPSGYRAVERPWVALAVVAPLALLSPLIVIDMGLLLITVIPIGAAAFLALGLHRLALAGRVFAAALAITMVMILWAKVLHPSVKALETNDPATQAAAFERMQYLFGIRLGEASERAAARAVATSDQSLAEHLLLSARPGPATDLLLPSIEQVWGGRTYSASGLWGVGLGAAVTEGRGIAKTVSYAENSYAVFVLHEHGALGGIVVLLAYLTLAGAVMWMIQRAVSTPTDSLRASRALLVVAVLLVTIPASYVALSNLGVLPITGQNMPFLGLNAWSDVTLCSGIVGILITGAIRTETA